MNAPIIYQPKTIPYAHQAEAFARFKDARMFMLAMEQRCGKSKVILDIAAYQFEQNNITALIIIAMPGRVHANWINNEVPAHLPDRIPRRAFIWDAGKANTKKYAEALDDLINFQGLSILAVNGEATITEAFRTYAAKFLKTRKHVMVTIDEFTLIHKTPGAKRTKLIAAIGRQPEVKIKTILDGTPVGEGPLDLYSPISFLSPSICGFTNFHAFKHHFAKWEKKTNYAQGRDYEELVEYQNLDELTRKLAPISFRVLRKDCWDVPPKVYQTHLFQLSPIQRKVYDDLANEYVAELSDGHTISVAHVLTRMLRLQQICGGYFPPITTGKIHEPCSGEGCEECGDLGVIIGKTELIEIDPGRNPRIQAMKEIYELNPGPMLIWARFQEDVDRVIALSKSLGRRPARYDGRSTNEEKDIAVIDFAQGRLDDIVGNPRSGGRGVGFARAEVVCNYSNDFSLLTRLQSEDRAEAKGKTIGTGIIDIAAENTLDDNVITPALRLKKKLTDYVLNERSGSWL